MMKVLLLILTLSSFLYAEKVSFDEAFQKIEKGTSKGMLLIHSPKSGKLYQEILKDYEWGGDFDVVRVSREMKITHPWSGRKVPAIQVLNNLGGVPSGTMTYIDGEGNHMKEMTWTNLFVNYKLSTIKTIDTFISTGLYRDYGYHRFISADENLVKLKETYEAVGFNKLLINYYENHEFNRFIKPFGGGSKFAMTELSKTFILVCKPENPLFERYLKEFRFYLPNAKLSLECGDTISQDIVKKYNIDEIFDISSYNEGHPLLYYVNENGLTTEAQGYTPIMAFADRCQVAVKEGFYEENLQIPLAEFYVK